MKTSNVAPVGNVVPIREKLGVQKVEDMPDWVSMFIYGEPGVGKTWLVGTAQDHEATSPMLLLDIEGGTTTLRRRKDLDVIPVRNIEKLVEVRNMLWRENDLSWKCIALDNMSELQALDMQAIMNEAYNRNPDKVDKDVPSPREWGKSREHLRAITRAFRDLPCHTIMTAHVNIREEEGQPTRFYPGFGGRARQDVPGFCDIVGYMTVEHGTTGPQRRIQFVGSRRVLAKDRFTKLGDTVVNPTIPLLWEKLYDE
jgi:phage nucleotide-binding protein